MSGAARGGPTVSVVMPAYQAEAHLPKVLPPLQALQAAGQVLEILLVDDGSPDGTAALARAMGARVLASGGRGRGPAAARNVAAAEARGELLWFVDSDVVVHEGACERLRLALGEGGWDGVFGSYCDTPPDPGFFSQYKNLLHHHQHQTSGGPSSSFWAGCGAIRRSAFLAVGGFDAQRFGPPSIEDIELGHRLHRAGYRMLLDPQMRCSHLKRWPLRQMVTVDIRRRALPWSRLILAGEAPADELNVRPSEKRAALLAGALLLSLPLALLPGGSLWPSLGLAGLAWAVNARFAAFLARRRGPAFAAAALAFHQVVYVYSGLSYAWAWCELRLRRPAAGR